MLNDTNATVSNMREAQENMGARQAGFCTVPNGAVA